MPFGLKNARLTYQRMMTKMFEPQLGKNVEVYIDDMVVKSKLVFEHLADLTSIFEILREHKLHLNVSKCSFGVGSGNFLGYMVTHRGIEVNPDQIKAINSLQPPRNPKEVQKLTGMMVTLNRFISRSAERCKPFFLCCINGKNLSGSRSVSWHSRSLNDIYPIHLLCLALWWMRCFLPILQLPYMP